MRKEWLLLLPSMLLYYYAPDRYDWTFCVICSLIFLLGAYYVLMPEIKKGIYLSFNTVFFFSYFFTSFVYPVLVYGTQTDRDNVINKAMNWNLLSHTSALALLFITCYIIGFSYNKKRLVNRSVINLENLPLPAWHFKVPYSLYVVCLLAYIGVAVWGFLSTGVVNMTIGVYLIDVFFTIFAICLFVNVYNVRNSCKHTFNNFVKANKFLLASSILVFVVFIYFGDRMPAIKTILMVFSVYYFFWKKIKIRHLLFGGLFLLLLLFFVRQTRGSGRDFASGNVSMSTVENVFDLENGALYMFADLFFINRELCLGYEYAQTHDLYYPQRMMLVPLHPFPVLPSFVSRFLWDVTPSEMDTGAKLNGVLDYNYNIEGHLGNHPASDLFMSIGLIGMLLVAYFLGRCIGYIQTKCYSDFYMGICYIVLMGWSMYLARSESLLLVRPLGYVFLFGYFLYRIPLIKRK